jgi:hypothetical protein
MQVLFKKKFACRYNYIKRTLLALTIIRTDVKPIANPAFVRRK